MSSRNGWWAPRPSPDAAWSSSPPVCVNARPLTVAEWTQLFDDAGFEVESTELRPMALLQPKRMIADEGLAGVARIVRNLIRDSDARQRVLAMRTTFRTHDRYLSAGGFVLRKR